MWKPEHRRAADRHGLRYPSDLSDGEWALIEAAIPPAKRGGRRREVNVREVLNAIFYVGTVRNFVRGWAVQHYQAIARVKRSPKRTANWALAMHHSRGGMIHSFRIGSRPGKAAWSRPRR
jgi:transposase